MNSNNYTTFFRLVQKADYLIACLLHKCFRYDTSFYSNNKVLHPRVVRTKALEIIAKTVKPFYEVFRFMDILKFEDENETFNFLEEHGLDSFSEQEIEYDGEKVVTYCVSIKAAMFRST